MGISPLYFSGISEFSDDFQVILDRNVAIASLPLKQMQNEQANLLTKKQLLTDLRTSVASLAAALSKLGTTGQMRALGVSSSNTSRVSVSLNGASRAGTYTVSEITSVAKAASETSNAGYATPDATAVSADGIMQLVVGASTYAIDLTGEDKNNLNGLRDAINAASAGVTASVLNTGTGDQPYYLAITSDTTGQKTLQLREVADEPASNVLTADNQGANAVFKLNGLPVERSENVVADVVPGLTFTIVSTTAPGEIVDLKLTSSRSNLATDLASLVSAYDSAKSKVNAQVGEAAGLLSGDYVVREIQHLMRGLASYEGSGTVRRLADIGIVFTQNGSMEFDTAKFYSLSDSQISATFEFLGSPTAGLGGLSAGFEQISNPVTGLIRMQQDQYDVADDRLSTQILDLTTRIELMQSSLSLRLQQADVLLAQLEAQQTMLDANIKALELAAFGKRNS